MARARARARARTQAPVVTRAGAGAGAVAPTQRPSPSPKSPHCHQVELSFRLQLHPSEVYPHFVRLLQALERTPHEYLGEAQYQAYYAEFLRPRAEPVAEPEAAFDER